MSSRSEGACQEISIRPDDRPLDIGVTLKKSRNWKLSHLVQSDSLQTSLLPDRWCMLWIYAVCLHYS